MLGYIRYTLNVYYKHVHGSFHYCLLACKLFLYTIYLYYLDLDVLFRNTVILDFNYVHNKFCKHNNNYFVILNST